MYQDEKRVLKIAMCDGGKLFLDSTKLLIQEILTEHHIPFKVDGYSCPITLHQQIKECPTAYDVMILNSCMNNQKGFVAAKPVGEIQTDCAIVLVAETKEFALKEHKGEFVNYLTKPVEKVQLANILLYSYKKDSFKTEELLRFSIRGKAQQVPCKEIEYIEIIGRTTGIYTNKDMIKTPYKISEAEKILHSTSLIRCHQSFIVNLKFVEYIQRYEAVLSTQTIVPISKAYYKKVKEAFRSYLCDDC